MKVTPSAGVGGEPFDPHTPQSTLAPPSGRAQASTAPAMIAGRAARTETVHIARQRLTPRAAARSFHPRGTAYRASTVMAIMIGVIITVRITIETTSPVPER